MPKKVPSRSTTQKITAPKPHPYPYLQQFKEGSGMFRPRPIIWPGHTIIPIQTSMNPYTMGIFARVSHFHMNIMSLLSGGMIDFGAKFAPPEALHGAFVVAYELFNLQNRFLSWSTASDKDGVLHDYMEYSLSTMRDPKKLWDDADLLRWDRWFQAKEPDFEKVHTLLTGAGVREVKIVKVLNLDDNLQPAARSDEEYAEMFGAVEAKQLAGLK